MAGMPAEDGWSGEEPLGIYTASVRAKKGNLYKYCIETQSGENSIKQIHMPIMQSYARNSFPYYGHF